MAAVRPGAGRGRGRTERACESPRRPGRSGGARAGRSWWPAQARARRHTPGGLTAAVDPSAAEHDHRELLARALPVYRRRRDALVAALGRHLDGEATGAVPRRGHHVWVTLRRPVDERALYAEALDHGTSFLPGGAVRAEPSPQTRFLPPRRCPDGR